MRTITLFIAMSLDGYIADSNGGVDWLEGQGDADGDMDTYPAFIKDVDTVLMGWNTYHQIVTELSPGEWVYGDLVTYVSTHRAERSSERIIFTKEAPSDLARRLKAEDGKDIWVCGGADLVRQLMRDDLIDRYHLSVIPTLLGSGIRLFENVQRRIELRLVKTRSYNGITELIYTRR